MCRLIFSGAFSRFPHSLFFSFWARRLRRRAQKLKNELRQLLQSRLGKVESE
jgi:hypothetical protein